MKPGDVVYCKPWNQYVKIISIGKPLPRGNINVAYNTSPYCARGSVKTSAESGIYFENKHLRPLTEDDPTNYWW